MLANLLAFHLLVTFILLIVTGVYSLHHRQQTAAVPFSLTMFLLAALTLLSGVDAVSEILDFKIALSKLRLTLMPFIPAAALTAAIANARRAAWLAPKTMALLLFIPVANLAFVWIPGLDEFLRSNYRLSPGEVVTTLTFDSGIWYSILLGYSAIVALSVFGVQIITLINSRGIYFRQTLLLSLGQIIPALIIILLAFGRVQPINGYNFVPHTFMLTAILNGWAIYRYQWPFTAPMARDIAIDLVSDIILVVNELGLVSDANKAARKFFNISEDSIGILPASAIIPEWEVLSEQANLQDLVRKEIIFEAGKQTAVYEATVNPARFANISIASGHVVVMREITDRKQKETQLQNLVRAVSQSPNSVLITDPGGVIEYVNPSFSRLTGYDAKEVVGKTTSILKSGETPGKVYRELWETIKAGKIWKGDLRNRRKDGELYWEETLIAPLFDQNGDIVNYISIKEDISARKEIDEILHRRLEELMMVNAISMAAASQLDLTSLVSMVGQQLEQSFNARSVLIALHNQNSEEIEIPYWTIDRKRVTPPTVKYGEGLVSHVLKTGQPLLIDCDFERVAPPLGYKAVYAREHGYPKTWLGVPIGGDQKATGVISLQNYETEYAFSEDDVRLLTTIAASISIAVENAHLFLAAQQEIEERIKAENESRQRADRMSVLYEVGHDITAGLELEKVLNALMQKCQQIAQVEVFTVGLYEAESSRVKFIKFNDNGTERPQFTLQVSPDENITGKVIERREPIYIPDCHAKEAREQYKWQHSTHEHARSYLGIPLLIGDKVTGILSIQSYLPNTFSPEQIQALEIIASQAAIAIENARLYNETRQRVEEMELLYEIGLELSADLNMGQVLRNLLDKCRQLLPMDSFYVAIYEQPAHTIYYPLFFDQGEFKNVATRDIRITPGITGEVILSRKTVYLADTADPQTQEAYQIIHIGGTPTRSFVGVPMIVRGIVVGVLSMQSQQPNRYTPDQIRLLETIATQAAIAVENSRLYEDARREISERRQAQENLQQSNQELQVQLNRVESLQSELREQAVRDPLTGLHNRRYLDEVFRQHLIWVRRRSSSLAVMMLDIDHFKSFNDTYGHKAGDQMLIMLGQLLRQYTRQSDVACRYGGEEFVILLLDAPLDIATRRAEEIRLAFEASSIEFEGTHLQTTISIGLAVYPEHGNSPEELLIQADQAMYAAKSSGRNQVVAWNY
jgi:diguanylate cyclase (GGDEF)-like protein/PAS domain S-box-containing protein